MNLKQLFSFVFRSLRRKSITFSERVGPAEITVTMINSPFNEERTQRYLGQIGSFLAQGLRTGQLPQIATDSHVTDRRST